ncbi:5-dehydro-4-deoxy-D-glucuronate isomerase [Simiduia agarivorans]|uniref:5-dehydro-4-deoxy-D-glucuronate isomerase n=1 Tax=Simiduia agarivorans (strain DSM 21679 / JCM 13881 / BCRC 17597 / SA1) TaxID=1117647 RepID=K4KXZ6_SIMAS|nr:5-dehydro-4-deoxy-D-glucuronate isomerase [Simiduia agarivorans]AFU98807.1 5-keto-4-deoxyuronate isomerase [Simiduia agarivorans SA1 = DSM 21679]
MKFLHTADQVRYQRMTNAELKDAFVMQALFEPGQLNLTYTDVDRAIVGAAVPLAKSLALPTHKELASAYFCERRELGVINIGGDGKVLVDGETYAMTKLDSLYVCRGSKDIQFISNDEKSPAQFYLVSYPAHRTTRTQHVPLAEANAVAMGDQQSSNERTIFQSICPGIVDSCQLVMGITQLHNGSVWNTKPPHTHRRRTEVYMYFDFDPSQRVFHFMGAPEETRALTLAPGHAIASPSWSIHSGAGSCSYSFIWAMGGENQQFDDMDHLTMDQLG